MPAFTSRVFRYCLKLRQTAVLLLLGAAASGQALALDPDKRFHNFVSNSWSIEQGLPQISGLAISQDAYGYLWVGTQAGLARFDGNRFTAYTPTNSPGLPGAFINALMTDVEGDLWVGTYKGLARWRSGQFTEIAPEHGLDADVAPNISALVQTPQGEVLATAGQAVWAVAGERLTLHSELTRPARALLAEGIELWIGSVGGVYLRQGQDEPQWMPFPRDARSAATRARTRARGSLWAGTSEGLLVLRQGRWQRYLEAPELAHTPIEAMRVDRDGNHWIAELAHLTRVHPDGSRVRVVEDGSGVSIRALFEDREANLWLGSLWSGVTRLRNGWTRRYSQREGLDTLLLWSVAQGRDGSLWVGSDDGLLHFVNGRFQKVVAGSELPHPSAYTLRVEEEHIWIGTRHGLAVLAGGELTQPPRFEALATLQINGLVRDARGQLWVATSDGVFRDDGDTVQRFAETEGLPDPRSRFLLLTRDGRLLLASQSGVFELQSERFVPFAADAGLPAGLDVTALHELSNGDLLAGTLSETLYLLSDGRWHPLGTDQGMPANAPFFLSHDENYLWVGGIRGIGRVPLSDLQALAAGRVSRVRGEMLLNERGDRRGGQKGFCCNGAGNAKGLQIGRTLWAPSRDGLVALDTQDANPPSEPPLTLIERVRVGSEWRLQPANAQLALPEDARDIAFEFTAINLYEPSNVGFRYRLLGYHDDWREPDQAGQRVVSYTNLPGGEYRFEVQGSTVEAQWSAAALLDLSIKPSFRETRGFGLLVAAAVALLGAAGFRLQRMRYRRRAEVLEATVQQRTADLAEANQRLHEATQTDPLTGLRNRRYLAAQIPKDLAFYARELAAPGPQPRIILFVIADIDHFKRINDTWGHAVGDRVIQQFAEVMQGQVRNGDYVARWGGEEFVLVFRPMPLAFLPVLGERLRSAVAAFPFDIGTGTPLKLTCSLGLCQYPPLADDCGTLDWEHLLELADRALYRVKREGRNGWGAYQIRPGTHADRVRALLRKGDQALEDSDALGYIGGGAAEAASAHLERAHGAGGY